MQKQKISWSALLTIVFGVLLAWFPMLGNYHWIADDFPIANMLDHGWVAYFHNALADRGGWRLFQYAAMAFIVHLPGPIYTILAVASHLAAVCLFYRASLVLFNAPRLSLAMALVMGLFPWGVQAMLWESAWPYVLNNLFFWLSCVILLESDSNAASQTKAFLFCFVASLFCQLLHEHLLFAFMALGTVRWLTDAGLNPRDIFRRSLTCFGGYGSILGAVVYIIAYVVLRPSHLPMEPGFNLHPVLSVDFYQYTNIDIFRPWLSASLRPLGLYDWTWIHWTAAAMFFTGFVGWIVLAWRAEKDPNRKKIPVVTLAAMIVLFILGASLVYVWAGGYALDSRKKYPFIPLCLLAFAWLRRVWRKDDADLPSPFMSPFLLLCLFGVATCWLQIGIWSYEIDRYTALIDFLRHDDRGGAISLRSDPDVYAAWPGAEYFWGERVDRGESLRLALENSGIKDVEVVDHGGRELIYHLERKEWTDFRPFGP